MGRSEWKTTFDTFNSPNGSLSSLEFLVNGKTLAGVYTNGIVWFWDITTGEHLKTFNPGDIKIKINDTTWHRVLDVFVDHIGVVTYAIGNKDGTISIQNGQTGIQKMTFVAKTDETEFYEVDKDLNDFEIRKPTVRRSIVRNGEKPIYQTLRKDDGMPFPIQYQLGHHNQSPSVFNKQPMRWVKAINFSPDGKTLVSSSGYRIIRERGWSQNPGPTEIWDVDIGEQLAALRLNISSVRFSGDGKTLALTGNHGSSIWDVDARREIATFPRSVDVRFSGDGKTLAIIEHEGYKMWNIATRREIATFSPVQEQIERIILSQDGTILTIVEEKGIVNVCEIKKSKKHHPLTIGYTKQFTTLVFARDSNTLASGDETGNIQLWNTDTPTKRSMIKTGNNRIDGLAFTTDSRSVISISYGDITVWDVATKKQIASHIIPEVNSHLGSLSFPDDTIIVLEALSFTPNSETLAIKRSSKNPAYEIWNINTSKPLQRLTEIPYQHGPIALAPDGKTIANSDNYKHTLFLWNTHTSEKLNSLDISGDVCTLEYSPDGKTLVVGTEYKKTQLVVLDLDFSVIFKAFYLRF